MDREKALKFLRKHVGRDFLNNKQRTEIEEAHKALDVLEASLTPPPDLDGLKRDKNQGCSCSDPLCRAESRGYNKGWNEAIDHLAERGMLIAASNKEEG